MFEEIGNFSQISSANIKTIRRDVSNNRPHITAARFFQINKSLIFKIMNSLITFFLVLVQGK